MASRTEEAIAREELEAQQWLSELLRSEEAAAQRLLADLLATEDLAAEKRKADRLAEEQRLLSEMQQRRREADRARREEGARFAEELRQREAQEWEQRCLRLEEELDRELREAERLLLAEKDRDEEEMRARVTKKLTKMRDAAIEELQRDIDARAAKDRAVAHRRRPGETSTLGAPHPASAESDLTIARKAQVEPPRDPSVAGLPSTTEASLVPVEGDAVYSTLLALPAASLRRALAQYTAAETLTMLLGCDDRARDVLLASIDEPMRSLFVKRIATTSGLRRQATTDPENLALRRLLTTLEAQQSPAGPR